MRNQRLTFFEIRHGGRTIYDGSFPSSNAQDATFQVKAHADRLRGLDIDLTGCIGRYHVGPLEKWKNVSI